MEDFISDEEFDKMPDTISDEEFNALPDEAVTEANKTLALGQGPIRMPSDEAPEMEAPEEVISDDDFNKLEELPDKTSTFEGVAGGVTSGATLSLDDELYGGIKAIGSTLGLADDQTSIMDDSSSFKQNYQAGRQERRDYKDQLKEDSPIAYKGSEIGGAIGASVIAPVGAGAKALLGRAAVEGGLYGMGESEAELSGVIDLDMDEMEIGEALKDTGIGAGIGVATAGIATGGMKAAKGTYNKFFGRGGKDLATDAAGDILELTPKQRADASKDIVKMGPGKRSTVAEELPDYLREKGGIVQSAKKLKQNSQKALDDAGTEIEDVLNTYDDTLKVMKETRPDIRNVKGVDYISTGQGKAAIEFDPTKFAKNADTEGVMNKLAQSHEAEAFEQSMGFDFNELSHKLMAEVEPLRRIPGYESQIAKFDKHIEKLRKFKSKGSGNNVVESIKELHQIRKNTDKLIKSFQGPKATQTDALLQEALIKSRREMSNHLQDNMLGEVQNFAQRQLDQGLIGQKEFDGLVSLQDRIYKANRNYKLASYVDGQIDQAIGRKDARKIMGLTDWIIGAQMMHSPQAGLVLGAKKAGEVIRPRAQLYSREMGKGISGAGKAARTPVIQQATQLSVTDKVQGTPYQQVFEGIEDQHLQAVKYNLLHQTDEKFRQMMKDKAEEEK